MWFTPGYGPVLMILNCSTHCAKKRAVIFLLCLLCTSLHAQLVLTPELIYSGANRDANHIDAIYEDHRGFIWAGNAEGLIRYDGATIKRFPYMPRDNDPAKGYTINHINEDLEGNIWCISNEMGLLQLKAGPSGYDTLRSYHPKFPAVLKFRFDKKGNLWGTANFQLFCLDTKTGKRTIYPLTRHLDVYFFDMNKEGDLWFTTGDSVYNITGLGSGKDQLAAVHKGYYLNVELAGKDLYLGNELQITRIRKDKKNTYEIQEIVPGNSHSRLSVKLVHTGSPSRFMVLHEAQSPVVLIDKATQKVIIPETRNINLSKNEIYSFCISRSGLLYIGTDKGLFRASLGHEAFSTFYSPDHAVNTRFRCVFAQHTDTLLLGSSGRGVYRFVRQKGHFVNDLHITIPGNRFSNTVNQLYRDKKGRIWMGTNDGFYSYNEQKNQFTMLFKYGFPFCITEDTSGLIWIGNNYKGIMSYDPESGSCQEFHYQNEYTSSFRKRYDKVWDIKYCKGYIYASTAHGPLRLDPVSKEIKLIFPQLQQTKIWSMSMSDSIWYISTQDKGLWQYQPQRNVLQPVPSKEQHFFRSAKDTRGNTWFINDKGLSRYNGHHFSKYETAEGLHCDLLSYMGIAQLSEDEMVVCGEDGFTVINTRKLPQTDVSPEIVFTQLAYGGSERGNLIALPADIKLDYAKGLLLLKWAITNNEGKDYRVRFQLEDIDTAARWANSHDEASYTDLPPGNYTMTMALTDASGKQLYREYTFRIIIVPPFWMTVWFKLIAIGIFAGAVIYLLYDWISRQRLSQEKLRYNMEALRSQMNPHFVFNALNSVQSFIYREQKETANEYLSEFSRLIRMILEYSREEFIPLPLEQNFLQLYLQVEAHRFRNKMTFEIIGEENNTCRVPPLLIQPLVENAIKHGTGSIDHQLHICIRFTLSSNILLVEVTDNGQAVQPHSSEKKDKISLGIKLIEERLALLTRTYKKKYSLSVQYRKLTDNAQEGTYAKLIIPQ